MRLRSLLSLVYQNVNRSKKNFLMSGIGIVVGVATFVFFIGLGEGIKHVVLGRIFLVDQIEVVRKKFDTGLTQSDSFMGLGGSRMLDAQVAKEFAAIPEVKGVYPKMKFTFPTQGHGGRRFLGRDIWAELIADGIEPDLVAAELDATKRENAFRDWDDPEASQSCHADADCVDGRKCQSGRCENLGCKPVGSNGKGRCPGVSYCSDETKRCEMPIPIVVSNHLLELYNGSLATAMERGGRTVPRLSKGTLIGVTLNATFGRSFLGKSAQGNPMTRRIRLVGFSDKAISVGITLPIGYVKRLNRRFSGQEAASQYHSIILETHGQAEVAPVAKQVELRGFALTDQSKQAEQAGMLITVITMVFSLISVIIVGVAAINIGHTFFMVIYQRKREIGVLRAVGASRGDVRWIIQGEAFLIGIFGGLLGAGLGFGAAQLADMLGGQLPDFPYKPDTFFQFPMWLWPVAIGFAIAFCLLGALFPASAAARMQPAAALTD